jgi:RNA recognition motif-containing protein
VLDFAPVRKPFICKVSTAVLGFMPLSCNIEYANYDRTSVKTTIDILSQVSGAVLWTFVNYYLWSLQVRIVADKDTNKPRGYAFIEYMHTRDMKSKFLQISHAASFFFHVPNEVSLS